MAKPAPTIETQLVNRNPHASGKPKPPPPPPTLTLSVPFTDIPNDPVNQTNYTFTVLRVGDDTRVSDAVWTLVPALSSPVPASYFGGTYPTGLLHFIQGQKQQVCIIQVPAGADLAADSYGSIVLSNFVGCKAGPTPVYQVKAPGNVVVADAVVTLSVPDPTFDKAAGATSSYTLTVARSGNTAIACSVNLAIAGTGANPLTAADFTGGFLNQTVSFGVGDTSKSVVVSVPAGVAPASDKTGVAILSAPSGCTISSTGGSVAVSIPGAPIVLPVVSLAIPDTTFDQDATVTKSYTINVNRGGVTAGACSVNLAIAGTGANPLTAADFTGGLLNQLVSFADGEIGPKAISVQVVTGTPPTSDKTGVATLSTPSGCTISSTAGSVAVSIPKAVVVADAVVALSVPVATLTRDDTADHDYSVVVTRSGNTAVACSVQLALAGSGTNPFTAADFTGGLLNQSISFAAGDTSKTATITVKAGTDPTVDLTGNVSISSPIGCKISPTASSVAVKIPAAVIVNPPGILPPEYTDFPLDSMTPIAVSSLAGLNTQLNALNGSSNCKTKYIQLADDFNYGNPLFTITQSGYYDTAKKEKWPLIVAGGGRSTGRSTNKKAHFRAMKITGNCVAVLYHETTRPIDGLRHLNSKGQMITEPYPYQTDTDYAFEVVGKDVFILRNWVDASHGVWLQGDVRATTVAANDFYGLQASDPNMLVGAGSHVKFEIGGTQAGATSAPDNIGRPTDALVHNNYMSQLQENNNGGECIYSGNGKKGPDDGTATQPYDVNMRTCWVYNNCMMTERAWVVYLKHTMNIYRNRIFSLKTWNASVSAAPQGNAYHMVSPRGPCGLGCKIKYNVIGGGQVSGVQGWNGEFDFNKFVNAGGLGLFIQMNNTGGDGKPLMGARGWKFRGNRGACRVELGSGRNGAFTVQGGLANDVFEDNPDMTFVFDTAGTGLTYDGNAGKAVTFGADGWNTNKMQGKDSGAATMKDLVGIGTVRKLASTAEKAQLTVADDVVPNNTGLLAPTKLVWDGKGDGGPITTDPGTDYSLIKANMTVHWPSDNMAADYPDVAMTWLAGGGFDLKAGKAQDVPPHACVYVWHKNAPPTGDVEFNFHATMVDNNPTLTTEGVYALFAPRAKGLSAYGADPNGWAAASWRTHPNYPTPGSDNIYRARMTGYRHSLMNTNFTPSASMQFRIRTYNGVDDGGTVIDPTVPNPIPNTGDTFNFIQGRKYLINVRRVGTVETGIKTDTTDGSTQTWAFDDPAFGNSGKGIGGWCGFQPALGRHIKIEPVPGVPFCKAA